MSQVLPLQPSNKPQIRICETRQRFIDNETHCLILGGPGSGKTTISLIKAESETNRNNILLHQKILFLSFARATISRVIESSLIHVSDQSRMFLEVNTYHGFCWSILQSHGYLIGLNKQLKLITPANAAAHLADIRSMNIPEEEIKKLERDEIYNLAFNEGILSFDLFAELTARIFKANPKLLKILSYRFPLIILDEFQDTNTDEWELIQELGKNSRLTALADPDQRIYEFRGADPARIRQFLDRYSPEVFDFGRENNRSKGTDIADYGNDILNGSNKTKTYSNVIVKQWTYMHQSQTYSLRACVISTIRRLKTIGDNWSIAVLVPTKRLMLSVSDALSSNDNGLPTIYHSVSLDPEGPTLAARIIALLLEPINDHSATLSLLIQYLTVFYRGKSGSNPTASNLKQSINLKKAFDKAIIKGTISNTSIIKASDKLLNDLSLHVFLGDPEKDWMKVRQLLKDSGCPRLREVTDQASYIRLLGKGSVLRESLAEVWRRNGSYLGAEAIVEMAFVKEHFSSSTRSIKGVIVMNMHKAKGKEFDEVILYENVYQGRFFNSNGNIDQARRNLRVSVTRARQRTTILTPNADPSLLLF